MDKFKVGDRLIWQYNGRDTKFHCIVLETSLSHSIMNFEYKIDRDLGDGAYSICYAYERELSSAPEVKVDQKQVNAALSKIKELLNV